MRSVTSAFFAKLQETSVNIVELIQLDLGIQNYYWTTCNKTVVSSGISWEPFPGESTGGIEESSDLGVAVTDFVLSNSGDSFSGIINAQGLEYGNLVVRRVFVDTPDLGTMFIYRGRIGDYSYNRNAIKGQARNAWNSANIDWPPYTYMDGCSWRFGSTGCGFDVNSVTVRSMAVNSATTDRTKIAVASGMITRSYAAGYYDRGRVDFITGANSGVARAIFAHSGDNFQMYASLPAVVRSGDLFVIRPGCRKRPVEDCTSKFNNISNFLGFPWMPGKEQGF